MHATLFLTAIALAGQVAGGGSGSRYATPGAGSTPPVTPPAVVESAPPVQGQQFGTQPLGLPFQDNEAPIQTPVAPPTTGQGAGVAPIQIPNGGQDFEAGAIPLSGTPVSPTHLKPADLVRSFLEEPLQNKLVGSPWSLADVVRGARSRGEQTRRVEAYWDLMAAVAKYNLSVQGLIQQKALQAGVRQPGPQWRQELQLLESRVQFAGHSAKVAQHRLQRLLGRSADESLPLPSDLPHCGAYGTRYEEIFAGRPSQLAGQLNRLLSLNYQAVQSQAEGVAAAEQWLQSVSQTRNPSTDGQGLLKAHELLTLRRNAFIEVVCDYNLNIARYAAVAIPGEVSTDRLLAMLINVSPSQRQNWGTQGVQHASAEELVGDRPRTFAEGERSLPRRSETPQGDVEHSILTQPKTGQR